MASVTVTGLSAGFSKNKVGDIQAALRAEASVENSESSLGKHRLEGESDTEEERNVKREAVEAAAS
jgi:hypothetical protein